MAKFYDATGAEIRAGETLFQSQQIRTLAFSIASGTLGKVDTGYNFQTPKYDHKSTTAPAVGADGFPATSDGSTIGGAISVSDICVVDDEIWTFGASSDDGLTYGTCWRIKYDPINNELLEEPKFFWHNWGHVNSINYNPDTDSLIMGNGGADYALGNKIYIIPNVSAIKDAANGSVFSLADYGVVIDVSDQTDFGVKLNVFWSNTVGVVYKYAGNQMLPNLAYAYSDDGNKFHVIVLGFDTYQYPLGTYVEPSGNNRWNGTYNILKTYQIGSADETIGNPGSYTHCGQGGAALCGTAFMGRGHSSFWYSEITPSGDTAIENVRNVPCYNWQTGVIGNFGMKGLDVTSRYLLVARSGQSSNLMINFVPR